MNKPVIAMLMLSITLSGCAAALKEMKADEERRQNEERQAKNKQQADEIRNRERLENSLLNNSDTVTCSTKIKCEKAFSLTKVFIQQHTDMKIQFSDDTTVSTYNAPADRPFYVSMTAIKIPGIGESANIILTASCKSLSDKQGLAFSLCADKIAEIYEGFKPFVESKL